MNKPQANRHKTAKKRFRLPGNVKILLAVCFVACIFAAVVLAPSPERKHVGGIELHGAEPEVEIYGPELPVNIVEGYTKTPARSVVVPEEEDTAETLYVYAAKDAECYHLGTCKFAFASAQKLTVYEATMLGYRPCGRCNPPVYTAEENP